MILLIFITANDSPNLACHLLMAFCDLEKRKHKKKNSRKTLVRANIEQKTLCSLLKVKFAK